MLNLGVYLQQQIYVFNDTVRAEMQGYRLMFMKGIAYITKDGKIIEQLTNVHSNLGYFVYCCLREAVGYRRNVVLADYLGGMEFRLNQNLVQFDLIKNNWYFNTATYEFITVDIPEFGLYYVEDNFLPKLKQYMLMNKLAKHGDTVIKYKLGGGIWQTIEVKGETFYVGKSRYSSEDTDVVLLIWGLITNRGNIPLAEKILRSWLRMKNMLVRDIEVDWSV